MDLVSDDSDAPEKFNFFFFFAKNHANIYIFDNFGREMFSLVNFAEFSAHQLGCRASASASESVKYPSFVNSFQLNRRPVCIR